jgi:tripartite-type tricarboxylate transporter receptor subunit TctC
LRIALACLALTLAGSSFADDYPSRPIHIVVPFPAGGASDTIARTIAHRLSDALDQPVLVDNRPGADGLIAGEIVAKAAPDGYTLLLGTATGMIYAPLARRDPPYDPLTAFSPIGRICEAGLFLYVNESVPARSVKELVALARAQPGRLSHGSSTAVSLLASLQVEKEAGVRWIDVPYKGESPMFQDLLAGHIQLAFATGSGLAHVREGRVRALATTLTARTALAPDVPAAKESQLPPIPVVPWTALFGPAGMPPQTIERLARELRAVLAHSDVRQQFDSLALQMTPSTSAQLALYVKEQLRVWRQAMGVAGVKP